MAWCTRRSITLQRTKLIPYEQLHPTLRRPSRRPFPDAPEYLNLMTNPLPPPPSLLPLFVIFFRILFLFFFLFSSVLIFGMLLPICTVLAPPFSFVLSFLHSRPREIKARRIDAFDF